MRFLMTRFSLALVLAFLLPGAVLAETDVEQRAALQMQLDQLNIQIKSNQGQLEGLQKQRTSLERDVAIVDAKIKDAQLGIKARDLTIKQIKAGITEKERGIATLDSKVAHGQESVAQMLRETRMIDDLSFVEVALGGNLKDLIQEIDDFGAVQRSLKTSFDEMAAARADLATRKSALQEQQGEEQELLEIQLLQQRSLKLAEKEKKDLVAAAKGQESVYSKIIASQKKSKAQIEAALFDLRDTTKSVTFGDMYAYAKEASAKTGVRAAVILGILAEESNLGQNVGTGNWKTDMHPTRDVPIFKEITAQLGLDADTMPVSKKAWYGWGGAMGPAQFIPSTWKLYVDRIAEMVGQNPPNPWDPRTATFATAILMKDNGAAAQTPAAERLAALRYLAGWKNATKSAYAFYGNEVMALANKFQQQIDILGS
jgi:membrane-bound lytic murein transglycosylase B